jgi:uncharacterized tellurite resistance protein B-like protein
MSFLSKLLGKERPDQEPSLEVVLRIGSGPAGYSAESANPGDPEQCWVPAGETTSVRGYDIPGGLVYVGEHLSAVGRWRGAEPALIDPRLPVDRAGPDRAGQGMGYWPSYSSIPSTCRSAYLEWLADGRVDPSAYIGYVFLFFYGLERRAISDATNLDSARQDLPVIREEVNRLLALYSHNRSFKSYATGFLSLLDATLNRGRAYEVGPPTSSDYWEFPLQLKIGLAHLVQDGRPIPPDWALAWLECDPEIHLRTPAKRCRDEFKRLFELRYKADHGDGMMLKPNKTRISAHYQPASASFGSRIAVPLGDLPDLTALSGPVKKLRAIADQCTNELDAYSRWLGRNPDSSGSLAAVALLPDELAKSARSTEVDALNDWLKRTLSDKELAFVEGSELLARWPSSASARLKKAESVLLAQFLQKRGCGIEPDVRFGGPRLSGEAQVLLYQLIPGSPSAPSPAYVGATVLVHLAAAVAAADGTISDKEQEHLERHLETSLDLTKGEAQRLGAHLQWLLTTSQGLSGLKRRLAEFKPAQRESIGKFLVTVAGADGHVSPSEITTLTKIYGLLGLESEALFSHVHALSTAPATEPVTIQPAQPSRRRRVIPPAPEGGFELDKQAIARILADTRKIEPILSGLFADEEGQTPTPMPEGERVAGLDGPHTAFLKALGGRSAWGRSEIEELAIRIGVLPDGAIELINEAALENVGEPLCEGEETVQIDHQVLKELAS